MHRYLNAEELAVAKMVINLSLANAAESFSKLAKEKVSLQKVEIPPTTPANDLHHTIKSDEKLFVLNTEVIGDLPATSYLIFTPENGRCMTQLVMRDQENISEEFQQAMLLEADNILTASVVSQFSNFFKVNIYGDVPSLTRWSKIQTEQKLNEKMEEYGFRVSFKTAFISENFNISPEFIWIFTHAFIDAVRWLATDEESKKEIQNSEIYLQQYVQ